MRVNFTVAEMAGGRWALSRGSRHVIDYQSEEDARRAAENMARAITDQGETGSVILHRAGEAPVELKSFAPDLKPF